MKTLLLAFLIYCSIRAGQLEAALVLSVPLTWIVAKGRGLASTGPGTVSIGLRRMRTGNQPLLLVLLFGAVVVVSTIARAS